MSDEHNGREDCGSFFAGVRGPKSFGVPDTEFGFTHELVVEAPSVVRLGHDVDPARFISTVCVVVAGEQVTEFVEGEGVWVAKALGDEFEIGTVGPAAEDATG